MNEHFTNTSWVVFCKVLSVNKLCLVQFVKCLTKRKIWKDICLEIKEKLFPALIVVDICWAAKQWGKISTTFTNTEVYNVSVNNIQVEKIAPKTTLSVTINGKMINFFVWYILKNYSKRSKNSAEVSEHAFQQADLDSILSSILFTRVELVGSLLCSKTLLLKFSMNLIWFHMIGSLPKAKVKSFTFY